MDDERLDWGNDDEDQPIASALEQQAYDTDPRADDGEDAVSLGDEGDVPDPSSFTSSQPPQHLDSPRAEAHGDNFLQSPEDDADRRVQEDGSPQARQSPRFSPGRRRGPPTTLTHALPEKPQWDPATMDSLIAVTSAPKPVSMTTTRSNRQRPNGTNNANPPDATDPLPQDWEVKQSRNEDGKTYYYNVRTQERTWDRPFADESSSPAWSNDRHGKDVWPTRPRDASPRGPDQSNFLSNDRESGGAQDSYHQASRSFEDRPHRSLNHSRRHDFSPPDDGQDGRGRTRAFERLPPQAAGLPSAADSSARGFSDRDVPYGQSGSRHARGSDHDDSSRHLQQSGRPPAQAYGGPDYSNQYPDDRFSREHSRRSDVVPERGRRLTTSFQPSSAPQDAFVQDQYTGRSSTLRHRSPPPRSSDRYRHYERGYSPAPPDVSSTAHASRSRRAASPGASRSAGSTHRAYEQHDVLPQRRPAPDYDDAYGDSSKRRRVDVSSNDSALARHVPADTGSHSFREPAIGSTSTADQPRSRRRVPLPPQQERFMETRIPRDAPPPSSSRPVAGPPSRPSNAQRADMQYEMHDTTSSRLSPDFHSREGLRPSSSRVRDNRFSNVKPAYAEEQASRERAAMDVDPFPPSRPPPPPEPVYSQAQFYPRSSREEPRDRDANKASRPNEFHPSLPSGPAPPSSYGLPEEPLSHLPSRLPPSPKAYRGDHRQPPEPPLTGTHSRPLHHSPVMDRRPPLRDEPPAWMMRHDEMDPVPPPVREQRRDDRHYSPDSPSKGPSLKVSGTNNVPIGGHKPNLPSVPPQGPPFPPSLVERRQYHDKARQGDPPFDYYNQDPARRNFDEPRSRLPDRPQDHGGPIRGGMSQQGPPEPSLSSRRLEASRQESNEAQPPRRQSRFGPPVDTQISVPPSSAQTRTYKTEGPPESRYSDLPVTPPHLPPSSALRSNYNGGSQDRYPGRRDPPPRGRLGQEADVGAYNPLRGTDRGAYRPRRRSPSPVPAVGEAFEEFEKGTTERYPQRGYQRPREPLARDAPRESRHAFPGSEGRQQSRWEHGFASEQEPSPPPPMPVNVPAAAPAPPKVHPSRMELISPAPPLPPASAPAPASEPAPAARIYQPVRIRRPPRTDSFGERASATNEQQSIAGRVETTDLHDSWGDRSGSRRTLMDRITDNGHGNGRGPPTLRDRLGGMDAGLERGDGYGSRNGSASGEGEGEGEDGGLMRNGEGKGRGKKKQKGRRYPMRE